VPELKSYGLIVIRLAVDGFYKCSPFMKSSSIIITLILWKTYIFLHAAKRQEYLYSQNPLLETRLSIQVYIQQLDFESDIDLGSQLD